MSICVDVTSDTATANGSIRDMTDSYIKRSALVVWEVSHMINHVLVLRIPNDDCSRPLSSRTYNFIYLNILGKHCRSMITLSFYHVSVFKTH